MDTHSSVIEAFREKFHRAPTVFIAPGRINLIGEHTDYNDGFVMPGAIDKHIIFAVAPSGTEKCNLYAKDFDEGVHFSVHDLSPGESWVNYLMGVIDGFQRRGKDVPGVDCVFGGNIPAGAGLSSSAALCSGFGFALNHLFSCGMSRIELAHIARHSEHEFAGVKVGIMDMYASLFGETNAALFLDCRTQKHEVLKFDLGTYMLMLIDTRVKHSLASSAYNDRRTACEEGVHMMKKRYPQIRALRDVDPAMLEEHRAEMEEDVFVKCRFVVDEIARTKRAAALLRNHDLKNFGALMYETHWGLSKAYQVSCDELDFLVSQAEGSRDRIIGSRMMGGGFGGCTLNLIEQSYAKTFFEKVRHNYFGTFKKEPDFYQVNLSQGVHQLKV
jgi:galactokinase